MHNALLPVHRGCTKFVPVHRRRLRRRCTGAACAGLLVAACWGRAAAEPAPPAPPAHREAAGTVFHLLGFSLSGTRRVDTAAIVAALPQHEGDTITSDQIREDADRVRTVLAAKHVHGDMTTATLEREGPGHHIWVVWDVHLIDGLSSAPRRGKRHFASQSFSGNVRLDAKTLAAATGLHAGDAMPAGSVSDARTGIEQKYDAVFPGATVQVAGKIKLRKDDTVVIDWQIAEPK